MKTLPVAVQVYSVRDYAEKDFAGTMKKLKDMGYDGVELAGTYGLSAEEIRSTLDALQLPCISAHVPFDQLKADMEGTVLAYAKMGCKWIAVPYLMPEDRPGTPAFADTLKAIEEIGRVCKKHGIQLLYHNHDFEFTNKVNGQYALDYMYQTIPADLLKTELDTCWVNVGGEEPAAFVRKYTGRAPVVHIKDFYKEGMPANLYKLIGTDVKKEEQREPGFFEFRPVGSGLQDVPAILQAAVDAGAQWVVVEQDSSNGRTSLEAVQMSREYLKKQGW